VILRAQCHAERGELTEEQKTKSGGAVSTGIVSRLTLNMLLSFAQFEPK
jgi:phage host-nuclease inhibitor protein Gam